ncbi:hypothetical protein BJP36_43180 [Moorena producens JHB]|uniref:Uncharacterized protein n=1 Tax=Moorena producens (strain JHB) TaxID=1454205 RepID=A0A9Q9ST44_MOOP1|nr:hypothetical protein [Moorena producens]WAN69165.1 hypothetical protein BJP36_43180 [Moorena producens JHB]
MHLLFLIPSLLYLDPEQFRNDKRDRVASAVAVGHAARTPNPIDQE